MEQMSQHGQTVCKLPDRLQSIQFDAYISRKELFNAESKYFHEIIEGYVRGLKWKKYRLRNVMDMRAGFGGYDIHLIFYWSAFSSLFFLNFLVAYGL